MSNSLVCGKKAKSAYELNRSIALRAAAEAVSNNDLARANSIIRIVSRSIKEDGAKKSFTNIIRLKSDDEIALFNHRY